MGSAFDERVFQTNRLSENVMCLVCFGGCVFVMFHLMFSQMCKDCGLEPRRKMMRGTYLSFLSNWMNHSALNKELPETLTL